MKCLNDCNATIRYDYLMCEWFCENCEETVVEE